MRRWIVTIIATYCVTLAVAQNPSYFFNRGKGARHFVGVSYGLGNTHWRSTTQDYQLFDHRGLVLSDGDARLVARNSHQSIALETLVPFREGVYRLGLGIAFEEYALYKIEVEDRFGTTERPFVETFRFDKFFIQGEVPFDLLGVDGLGCAVNAKAGWYGFTGVNSLSLFGERRLGRTWFAGISTLIDVKVHDIVYLIGALEAEYKFFSNSRDPMKGRIKHNLYDYGLRIGFRVHVL